MDNPDIEKVEKFLKDNGIYFDNDGGDSYNYNINVGLYRKMDDRQFLKHLADLYIEKRSDISDMIDAHLNGTYNTNIHNPESRFVSGEIFIEGKKVDLYYDTLTTLIEYKTKDMQFIKSVENIGYTDK